MNKVSKKLKKLSKKWWFWLIVVLVVVIIISILPIWCSTYYVPDRSIPGSVELIERTHCGSIFGLGRVY